MNLKYNLLQLNNECIFKICFIFIAFICIILFSSCLKFRNYVQDYSISVFKVQEFYITPITIIAIHFIKLIIESNLRNWVDENLNIKYVGEFRQQRINKLLKWIYDGFYYSCTSAFCFIIFRNEPWYPTGLGGTNFIGYWHNYPQLPQNEWVSIFYMVQTGSHIYALMKLIVEGQKLESKYWEYMLHHFLAVCLLLFSALQNCVQIGIVILAIHDLADILLSWSRAYNDTIAANKYFVYLQYGLLKFTWVYTRLWIFPQVIYDEFLNIGQFDHFWPQMKQGYYYMVIQCVALLVMHIYWTYQMAMVGVGIFKSGKYKNQYDNRENKIDN
ncbi:hypothetical protein pb186bvf_019637 [Paramecium bursaria]